MSTYSWCHRGGQEGIATNHHEMLELAKVLDNPYSDAYIPIPGMGNEIQKTLIAEKGDKNTYDDVVYWESDTGEHGWCNKETGQVVQWG